MLGARWERQVLLRTIVGALTLTACHTAVPEPRVPLPASRLRLTFVPESPAFAAAAREYEQLWAADGARIVRAMESTSGLTFRDIPMRIRASYSRDTKKSTLIHELGHRLQQGLFRRDEEEHGPLFLWLYDVWVQLYGREFADAQVEIEKRRRGPYPKAWDDALALSASQRASRWRAVVAERMPTRR